VKDEWCDIRGISGKRGNHLISTSVKIIMDAVDNRIHFLFAAIDIEKVSTFQ
jgi:hypothetical protein